MCEVGPTRASASIGDQIVNVPVPQILEECTTNWKSVLRQCFWSHRSECHNRPTIIVLSSLSLRLTRHCRGESWFPQKHMQLQTNELVFDLVGEDDVFLFLRKVMRIAHTPSCTSLSFSNCTLFSPLFFKKQLLGVCLRISMTCGTERSVEMDMVHTSVHSSTTSCSRCVLIFFHMHPLQLWRKMYFISRILCGLRITPKFVATSL